MGLHRPYPWGALWVCIRGKSLGLVKIILNKRPPGGVGYASLKLGTERPVAPKTTSGVCGFYVSQTVSSQVPSRRRMSKSIYWKVNNGREFKLNRMRQAACVRQKEGLRYTVENFRGGFIQEWR